MPCWSTARKAVANVHIQESAADSACGQMVSGCCTQDLKDSWYTISALKCCGFCTLLWIVGITIMLIVLGAVLIGPHFVAAGYLPTTCNVTDIGQYSKGCSCGKYCSASEICVNVNVDFHKGEHDSLAHATLYLHEGPHACTFTTSCNHRDAEKQAQVDKFIKDINSTLSFPCLYDPEPHSDHVIRNRRYDSDLAANLAVVFPSVALIIAVLWALIMFSICGCKYFLACKPSQEIIDVASNLDKQGIEYNQLTNLPFEERKRLIRECRDVGYVDNAAFGSREQSQDAKKQEDVTLNMKAKPYGALEGQLYSY